MKRDIHQLFTEQYDVVVVGAGVYGACTAAELSKAGYKVALIESRDFGAATSANSLGILHGGLRYIQHFDFKRMKRSIESRHFFMQLAPQLIDIVSFKYPLSGWGVKGPVAMRIALWINDIISYARNQGLPSNVHIPSSAVASNRADDMGWYEHIESLNGIGIWHEAVVKNLERLVLEVAHQAFDNGANIANYCQAERLIANEKLIKGVAVKDKMTGNKGIVRASWVIDTCGFNTSKLRLRGKRLKHSQPWVRAVNINVKGNPFGDDAITLEVKDNLMDGNNKVNKRSRMLFLVPQENQTLIGTFYTQRNQTKQGLRLTSSEKKQLLSQINKSHADLNIKEDEVIRWQSGWLPAESESNDTIELLSKNRLELHDFSTNNASSGMLEVTGVKFTTAPSVAKEIKLKLGEHIQPSMTNLTQKVEKPPIIPTGRLAQTMFARYGKHWRKAKEAVKQNPSHLKPISRDLLRGEIHYACEHEMAQRLNDVMFRRFKFNLDMDRMNKLARKVSIVMQKELGWSNKRHQIELESFQKVINEKPLSQK